MYYIEVYRSTEAVLRRYEFFEYTGPYDQENESTTIFLDEDLPEPPEGEWGPFIAANMVAANLAPAAALSLGDRDLDGRRGGRGVGTVRLVLL